MNPDEYKKHLLAVEGCTGGGSRSIFDRLRDDEIVRECIDYFPEDNLDPKILAEIVASLRPGPGM